MRENVYRDGDEYNSIEILPNFNQEILIELIDGGIIQGYYGNDKKWHEYGGKVYETIKIRGWKYLTKEVNKNG